MLLWLMSTEMGMGLRRSCIIMAGSDYSKPEDMRLVWDIGMQRWLSRSDLFKAGVGLGEAELNLHNAENMETIYPSFPPFRMSQPWRRPQNRNVECEWGSQKAWSS
jgi:hypothetical protein